MDEGCQQWRKDELQKTDDGLKRATNDSMRNNLSICDNIWNFKQQDVMICTWRQKN
jgi:hypothetical protein